MRTSAGNGRSPNVNTGDAHCAATAEVTCCSVAKPSSCTVSPRFAPLAFCCSSATLSWSWVSMSRDKSRSPSGIRNAGALSWLCREDSSSTIFLRAPFSKHSGLQNHSSASHTPKCRLETACFKTLPWHPALAQPGEVFHLKTVFVNSWRPNLLMINLCPVPPAVGARLIKWLNVRLGEILFLQRCPKFRKRDGVNLRNSRLSQLHNFRNFLHGELFPVIQRNDQLLFF